MNLWNAFIEPWSFQKIFGFEKLKTLWNNWLFRQLIHSVQLTWQGHKDLNPEPTVLETAALPIELYPYVFYSKRNETLALWWAFRDSNPGLSGYEPEALTN